MPTVEIALDAVLVLGFLWAYRRLFPLIASWVFLHAVFSAIILLVFLILGEALGVTEGIPHLFWHDTRMGRLAASTAVALLFALVCIISYYIDPYKDDTRLRFRAFFDDQPANPVARRLKDWYLHAERYDLRLLAFLAVIYLPLLVFLVTRAAFVFLEEAGDPEIRVEVAGQRLAAWLAGLLLGSVTMAVLIEAGRLLNWIGTRLLPARAPVAPVPPPAQPGAAPQPGPPPQAGPPIERQPETAADARRAADAAYAAATARTMPTQAGGATMPEPRVRASVAAAERRAVDAAERHTIENFSALRTLNEAIERFVRRYPWPFLSRAEQTLEPEVQREVIGLRSRALTSMIVLLAVFAAFYYIVLSHVLYDEVSAAVAICALLGLIAMFFGVVGCFTQVWRLPIMLALIGLGLATNNGTFKLTFPGLESYYEVDPDTGLRRLQSLDRYQRRVADVEAKGDRKEWDRESGLLSSAEALKSWQGRLAGGGREAKPKLVVVAVSGGGVRSALWTTHVLVELENELGRPGAGPAASGREAHGLHDHVRLITGASGGMVGAAHYVRAIYNGRLNEVQNANPIDSLGRYPGFKDGLAFTYSIPTNGLEPVARQLALGDLPSIYWPGEPSTDRGRVLEDTWKALGDLTFQLLRPFERDGSVPSLALTPMIVDDGRRLIISNLDMAALTVTRASTLTGREGPAAPAELLSRSTVEFFRLFPTAAQTLPVRTAVRMNASFPWVSPSVDLPTDPPCRIIDAGLYDNYGVDLAARWIAHNREWLGENTGGVLLLQIRDWLSEQQHRDLVVYQGRPAREWGRSFQFLTSPLEGLDKARQSINSFRNDELIVGLDAWFNEDVYEHQGRTTKPQAPFFTTIVFESPAEVALNWSMTGKEVREILRGMGQRVDGDRKNFAPRATPLEREKYAAIDANIRKIKALKEWWDSPGAPADDPFP
jgi:hypothetical protein